MNKLLAFIGAVETIRGDRGKVTAPLASSGGFYWIVQAVPNGLC